MDQDLMEKFRHLSRYIESVEKPRAKAKNGWLKIRPRDQLVPRLNNLISGDFASPEAKARADEILKSIVNDEIEKTTREEAFRLLQTNRPLNKQEKEKLAYKNSKTLNAIMYACQACENLAGKKSDLNKMSASDKKKLVFLLNSSATILMEVQKEIITNEEEENADQG